MLLAELVDTTAAVAATRSRNAKVAALAALLTRLDADELPVAIGLLMASPRQRRLGVGWRTLAALTTTHADAATLTITDVDVAFERLAGASGTGSQTERAQVLHALAARATGGEWDFLARVIGGELRTGALEGVLLDAIAKASEQPAATVRRAAMLSGDLGETAGLALVGDAGALDAVGLRVGRPVLPMLASTASTAGEAVRTLGDVAVEAKLDGARIQVHRAGDDVRVYTRSLADITHRVPELTDIVRSLPAERLILDGETLSLDESGAPRAFQDTMARFGAEVSRTFALRPWFFDLLHVDGRDLLDEPLHVRRTELARVAADWIVPGLTTTDPDAAEAFAAETLAGGHEGVVVKALDAPYAAGRRGATWLKVKPVLTYDLVVLGVEPGSGRREGWLSNLHLGARDATGEFGGGFVMVGKTFKGLTDEVLRWQTDYFPTIETSRTPYVLHVEPTTVVEIAIDGVQRSTRYPGGIALRFARVKTYRPDKGARDADTVQTLRALLPGGHSA